MGNKTYFKAKIFNEQFNNVSFPIKSPIYLSKSIYLAKSKLL